MPDNWEFVLAAYGLAALLLGGYWRRLRRLERVLTAAPSEREGIGGGASPSPMRSMPLPPPEVRERRSP